MPKLPPDEKLFTPEQLTGLNEKCACGYPLGQHRAQGRNCPGPTSPKGRQWMGEVFSPADGSVAEAGAPVFEVGAEVKFGKIDSLKTGVVIEVVPAGQLPTTKGLRHISDKRRTPKPRDCVSYVVVEGNILPPSRENLYWPNTFGLIAV